MYSCRNKINYQKTTTALWSFFGGKGETAMARADVYKATDFPGIKQRIKDGKYLVVIDLGRQPKLDKKTGT